MIKIKPWLTGRCHMALIKLVVDSDMSTEDKCRLLWTLLQVERD